MENNFEISCEYFDPVYSTTTDIWNYQKIICFGTSTDQIIEKIENASTGSEFYVSKTINYGDILISFFLLLFVVFGAFKFLVDFVIPKFMNFKRS